MLKYRSLILVLLLLFLSCDHYSSKDVHIIPAPQTIDLCRGDFTINEKTQIQCTVNDPDILDIAYQLANEIIDLDIADIKIAGSIDIPSENMIILDLDPDFNLNPEAYLLDISKEHIRLSAATSTGLFYAFQTLRQLLPTTSSEKIKIPCLHIQDAPYFTWRGMHLDVSRHFMDVTTIKKYIDLLAQYKMNVFHWHLTDDQGWRIEIKQYPKLTNIGAWRTGPDGQPYGGYYTQNEVRDIVEYAAKRYIQVVPEIELPGHCRAALAAYPELSCSGGPFNVSTSWGVHEDVFCAGKNETFIFLENVLTEIMDLFPSAYIHIGGDEVPKDRWENCPDCQRRISDEGLRNEFGLQSYFIGRISEFIRSNNRKVIGWEEILEGGISEGSTLQTWRRAKTAVTAAKMGHDVIMSHYKTCYFNRSAFRTPLHEIYEYNPIPLALTPDEARHIIGAECALWTEYVTQETLDEYMFPRLLAFAEVTWSDPDQKDFKAFYSALGKEKERLSDMGVTLGPEAEPIGIKAQYDPALKEFVVQLIPKHPDLDIYYCYDKKQPTRYGNRYTKPLRFSHSGTLCAQAFLDGHPYGKSLIWQHCCHLAQGIAPNLKYAFHPKYDAGGELGLTDGIKGSDNFLDGCWQGFEGNDLIATIDLGAEKPITYLESSYLQKTGSWIFMPETVEYSISSDGLNFERIAVIERSTSQHDTDVKIENFIYRPESISARFIKVKAKNVGTCPDWHHGAGGKAWIFADEIVIK